MCRSRKKSSFRNFVHGQRQYCMPSSKILSIGITAVKLPTRINEAVSKCKTDLIKSDIFVSDYSWDGVE